MGLLNNQSSLPNNVTPTLFTGCSSVQGLGNLHNIDLVRQDLLNALYTRKTERVMQPNTGNEAFDLIFELQNPTITQELQDTITAIVQSEPRVQLQSVQVVQQTYGYIVNITVLYLAFQTVETLVLDFNSQAQNNTGNNTGI